MLACGNAEFQIKMKQVSSVKCLNYVVRPGRGRRIFARSIGRVAILGALLCLAATACSSAGSGQSSAVSGSTASGSATHVTSLAGKKLGIALCCPVPQVYSMANAVVTGIHHTNSGLRYVSVDAQGSVPTSQNDLQEFIAQQYNAIWSTLPDVSGFASLATQAVQQHMVWVNDSGGPLTGATENIMISSYAVGEQVGVAVAHWMQQHGQANSAVGASEQTIDPSNTLRTTGFIAGLHSVLPDVKVYVAADNSSTSNTGATIGANLLEAHPNISVFYGWYSQGAVGLAQGAKEAGKTNPNTFLVATPETDTQVLQLIASGSILQIALDQNAQLGALAGSYELQKALEGQKISPTAWVRTTLVTSANVAAITKRDASPQDYPSAVDQVLVFSNTPLSAAEPLPHVTLAPLPS
jgi:ABC-type sugar transport system substrate-binding protein